MGFPISLYAAKRLKDGKIVVLRRIIKDEIAGEAPFLCVSLSNAVMISPQTHKSDVDAILRPRAKAGFKGKINMKQSTATR